MTHKREVDSYEKAVAKPSAIVWPGCGDGRCRTCGRVHDFRYSTAGGRFYYHHYHCWYNWMYGCPDPKPEPVHDLAPNGYCRVCHRRFPKRRKAKKEAT